MNIIIYTDGACSGNPGPGGWSVVLSHSHSIETVSGYELHTTNNRMELLAVIEALKKAISLGYDKITIKSDSAYVVNAINKKWIYKWRMNDWKTQSNDPVKNCDLWKQLYLLLNKYSDAISLVKVKGHKGDAFNELADQIAKEEVDKAKRLLD